jgi:hypothetical protein
MPETSFAHGRFPNGLRKVEITDNYGRVSTHHVTGEGTLAEALADIIPLLSGDWGEAQPDISALSRDHWMQITSFTARCGSEVWEYYARH